MLSQLFVIIVSTRRVDIRVVDLLQWIRVNFFEEKISKYKC